MRNPKLAHILVNKPEAEGVLLRELEWCLREVKICVRVMWEVRSGGDNNIISCSGQLLGHDVGRQDRAEVTFGPFLVSRNLLTYSSF